MTQVTRETYLSAVNDLASHGILSEYCWTHGHEGGWSCATCLYIIALSILGNESVRAYAETLTMQQELEEVAA